MAARLGEPDGPEIVVINPESAYGWLEEEAMGSARARLLDLIGDADRHRRFRIYKFSTMHPHNNEVARQARDGDERVYPLGKWFRKLSIDEVPQFWNVLRGDMSIVGPRPHLIEHNDQFSQFMANYHVRTFVKPGITGLAQVRGYRGEARSNADIENRVACDIEYLENWNLSLECGIILRTCAQIVIPPRTAY